MELLWTLSKRDRHKKKGLQFVQGKKKMFFLFLYINLHLLQTKRGCKNKQKSVYILLPTCMPLLIL